MNYDKTNNKNNNNMEIDSNINHNIVDNNNINPTDNVPMDGKPNESYKSQFV
jgi:hypothetical protein